MAYVDKRPLEAFVIRVAFAASFLFLGLGGLGGLIQALHRTGYLQFIGEVTDGNYYTVLTSHGVFIVLFFTIFFLVGVFTWALTRSLDRDLGNPRLTKYWITSMCVGAFLTGVTVLAGFTDALPLEANVLYTMYAPLQAHPLYYIGLTLFVTGTWVAGVDWIKTYLDWRSDNPNERIPLKAFMVLTTTLMWYITTLGIAVEVLFFLLPWSLGLVNEVNPTLTRTLFWYFGHAVVYFWLIPAYLLWYTVLPKLSGGRLFSDPLARVVFILFLILSVPVGIHHQYVDPGIPEGFKFVAMTNTMFLLLPSLLTAFTVVASIEHGGRQRGGTGYLGWLRTLPWKNPAFSGMALAGVMFAAGGFSGMINAGMSINYLIHNTLWVPGHFHLTVGTASALTFMAGAYWLVPQLTGKKLASKRIAAVQPFIWFIGMTFMSNAMHRAGLFSMPRRTSDPTYEAFDYSPAFGTVGEINSQIALGGVLLTVSLGIFLYVIVRTWFGGEKVDEPVDAELPPALSGPEHSPRVLDNLKLWVGVAVLLVILAYTVPIGYIASDGLWSGSETFPTAVDALRTLEVWL
ncbi:MAG: b(o/a)3-type cytochrome-c oxidase subunit 1 [Halobacteriales archaeon]